MSDRLTDRDGNPILVGSKIKAARPEREWHGVTIPADSNHTDDRGFVTSLEDGMVHYRHHKSNGYSVVQPEHCVTLNVRPPDRDTAERENRETADAVKRLRRKRVASPRRKA